MSASSLFIFETFYHFIFLSTLLSIFPFFTFLFLISPHSLLYVTLYSFLFLFFIPIKDEKRNEKDGMVIDLNNLKIECTYAKTLAENLRLNLAESTAELESLRSQVQVLTERERSFSDVSGASQLAATLQLSEELENENSTGIRKLGNGGDRERGRGRGRDDNNGEKTVNGNLQVNSTDMLLTEISRLTTSLEIKEEALRHMQLQLEDARRVSGIDDSRSYAGSDSPYKELFANSEAEMHRLKVMYLIVILFILV